MVFAEQRLDVLDRLWKEQGCVPLPSSDRLVLDPLAEVATVFALLTSKEVRFCGASSVRRPGRGRGVWQGLGAASRVPCYQVVLQPGTVDALEKVTASLSALGVEPAVHDVALVPSEWELEALRIGSVGWTIRIDGHTVGRIGYLRELAGLPLDPLPLELRLHLEPLIALAGSGAAESTGEGGAFEYARWRALEERQTSDFENRFVKASALVREAEEGWAGAKRCIESALMVPAWELLTRAQLAVALLRERGELSQAEAVLWTRRVGRAAEQCARALTEGSG